MKEKEARSLGPSRVQTERIVRARARRVCVRLATPLRVKAESSTRYKNKILNRRQSRAYPREKWKREDGLIVCVGVWGTSVEARQRVESPVLKFRSRM